jgi:hypothetical protein
VLSTPGRQAAGEEDAGERVAERGGVVGRLPHDGVAAQQRRHEVPGRHRDREVAGGDDPGDADRHAEGEQLLVAHLARHGLAVQPPSLAEEEVAGVDDLLHLARASAIGLPTSRVTSCASASKLASTSRPILAMTWPRTGAGVAPHAGWAALAARKASTSCSGVASETSATTSDRRAGLVLVTVPAAPTSGEPATDESTRVMRRPLERRWSGG